MEITDSENLLALFYYINKFKIIMLMRILYTSYSCINVIMTIGTMHTVRFSKK